MKVKAESVGTEMFMRCEKNDTIYTIRIEYCSDKIRELSVNKIHTVSELIPVCYHYIQDGSIINFNTSEKDLILKYDEKFMYILDKYKGIEFRISFSKDDKYVEIIDAESDIVSRYYYTKNQKTLSSPEMVIEDNDSFILQLPKSNYHVIVEVDKDTKEFVKITPILNGAVPPEAIEFDKLNSGYFDHRFKIDADYDHIKIHNIQGYRSYVTFIKQNGDPNNSILVIDHEGDICSSSYMHIRKKNI